MGGRVWILAIRDIAPGEELTYDYSLYDGDEDEARELRCPPLPQDDVLPGGDCTP